MKLRDYQIDIASRAVAILKEHGLVYLAMQPRTGKTITSLTAAKDYGATNVLFVTKKKAISSIDKDAEVIGFINNVTITNYDQLHNHRDNDYDLIIVDEAHSLGAYPKPSDRARNLAWIVQDRPMILLSGTPTPESYSQLYHQLWPSNRSPWSRLSNFYTWAKSYVKVVQKKYAHGLVNDYSNADRHKIEADVSHLFIRYSQEEAGFKQIVEEEVLYVTMQPATYKFADALKSKRVITNKNGETVLADTEVKLMQKLHQIYSGTVIIDEPARHSAVFDESKGNFIKDYFKGLKIAIYYKFIAEGVMLKGLFNWTDKPEEFNTSTDKVFISQIQSGREGVDLRTADALVMLNIDFAAVSYWQVRERIQSKDRETAAKVYWIFSVGGIEQKIYKAVHDKKDYSLSYFRKDFGVGNTKQAHPQIA
jgi:hypothetical protein